MNLIFSRTEHERGLDVRQPRAQQPHQHVHPVPVHHPATLAHRQGHRPAAAARR